MILTKDQAIRALRKEARSKDYLNVPQMGHFTEKEIADGIDKNYLRFHFDNGVLYCNIVVETKTVVGKKGTVSERVDREKVGVLDWLNTIHSTGDVSRFFKDKAKTDSFSFEEWLSK